MDTLSATPSLALRRAYRKAGTHTWMLIRELYLAGVAAAELAVRFDVSVHTVRKRATREGWSRKAQAEAVNDLRTPKGCDWRSLPVLPAPADPNAGAGGPPEAPDAEAEASEADPSQAAYTLLRRAAGAAMAGRLEAAQALLKLAEGFARSTAGQASAGDGGRRFETSAREDRLEALPPYHPDALAARPADVQRADAERQRAEASRLRLELETRLAEVFAGEAERRALAAEQREAMGGA